MKRFILTFFSLTLFFALRGFAQCPDPSITADGFHPQPEDLPCIINNGTAYSETVQVNVPASFDTTLPLIGPTTVTIDSIRIDSINNRPTGIAYSCTPSDCVFEGGSAGCVTFSGSTTDPAMDYVLEIYATAWVKVAGSPQTFSGFDISQAGLEYYLTVISECDNCPNTGGEFTADALANNPDICVGGSTTLSVDITDSGNRGPYTYEWSDPSNSLDSNTVANPVASPATSETYNVTVSDTCGNTTISSVDVNVITGPAASFGVSDNGNGAFSFDASASTGVPTLIYDWDFGDGSAAGSGELTTHTYTAEGTYDVVLTVTDDCGASDDHTEPVDVIITSVNDLSQAVDYVKVYPNPNNGTFEVRIKSADIKSNYSLRLMDLQGKEIYAESVSNQNVEFKRSMNFNHLNAGMYFLHISSDGLTYVERLVIQK
ncbi:MAG: PKD domain-containing protein [Chitinophagales bacterium]